MKNVKRTVSLVIVCVMFLSACLPCLSAGDSTVLRVACYPLDGFFEYDDDGEVSGYGVDLLDKISQFTGITFEYVRADSWEITKQMLMDGVADIRLPASAPSTPSKVLSYSTSDIIDTYHVILAMKDRDDLFYQDYDTIRTLKIAVSDSFYRTTGAKDYLDSIGVTEDQLVLCGEYNDCSDLLYAGEVDCLVSNIMDMNSDMKMLARFNSISNYISMTINNPMLSVLDDAISQIKLDEPLFLSNLYADWYPERTVVPLTLEESEYLSGIDSLTFAFQPAEGYLSRCENGEYYGIYTEMAKCVCEKLGVAYNAVSMNDVADGSVKADVYSGFFYDRNYAKTFGVAISSPLNNINYYIVQKKETSIDESTCKIAAVEKFRYTKVYLQKKYSEDQFVYFDTYEECLRAIENGTADIAVINNYIAEYYLEMYQFSDLSARLTTEYSHLFCFATADNNEMLASVISKAISSISDDEMNQFYIRGMENKPETHLLTALLYRNPLQFTLAFAGVIVVIIVFILMFLFISKSNKQNKSLEKAISAKSDFLARMSHDMRTPLNAVLGFARLAKDETGDKKAMDDYVAKILTSGEYLLGLINDILDASKLDSGKIELHYETVNGPEFLKGIAEEFSALARLKGITLVANLEDADTPYVRMDKLRTRQIYSNLLNNAIKFSKPGSTIEWYMKDTRIDETHMEFVTTVTDHGCGMTKEFTEHMFEPFTQEISDTNEQKEGTGLGLTIVKRFVELGGGTINVSSVPGEGTTFTIRMKRKIPTEKEIAQIGAATVQEIIDYSPLSGKRILLCEDHPLNREIVIRLLKKVGVETECAEDGGEGVAMFEKSAPGYYDAVLMDIRMPYMDGLEASRKIRDLGRDDSKTVPIIAETANAYNEDISAALAAGMNALVPKPIDPPMLYKILMEQLTKK